MAALTFEDARACVLSVVRGSAREPAREEIDLADAAGRVLAETVTADRDYPPLARSMRDGYAVRTADLPGVLKIAGEIRAGEAAANALESGQAIAIMTGAPVPEGADAVVMVEQTQRDGNSVAVGRELAPGANINPQGAEARGGDVLLAAGRRLGYAEIAALATVGKVRVKVFQRPRVAIVATGDELVSPGETPLPFQIRNSNAHSLAVQIARAGGIPEILPTARDQWEHTRGLLSRGLESDLLLVSGGVSAGKYDIVEDVLAEAGAEFFFDRVLIQPGQPLVFGRVKDTLFFGLPGNPASTMVTFELFARAAVELLGGESEPRLPLLWTRLSTAFRHKPGLTRFLPACLSADGSTLTPVPWKGSSDFAALARANAFLVADASRESWQAGEMMAVLPR